MHISATVRNTKSSHDVVVRTDGSDRKLTMPAKSSGPGSAINGGELLTLALATCYCNDLYREAQRLKITLDAIEVEASAVFPGIGLAATDINIERTFRPTHRPPRSPSCCGRLTQSRKSTTPSGPVFP
jgi:organic hydroperoxide reductase OsmC/OhrA